MRARRLQMLSRRKAAAALEGITQEQMDEFRSFRLIRVPSASVETVICGICTLLNLEIPPEGKPGPAKKRVVLAWNEARLLLGRQDLLRSLTNFDALRLVESPDVLAQLRRLIRADRMRAVGVKEVSARNKWQASMANARNGGEAERKESVKNAWGDAAKAATGKGELSPVTIEAAQRGGAPAVE